MSTVIGLDDHTVTAVAAAGEDVAAAVALAVRLGLDLPLPGSGVTPRRWAVLRDLGRANLTVARIVEAHSDALAILGEWAHAEDSSTAESTLDTSWGVFAAESPQTRLVGRAVGSGFEVDGVKPWCSLAARLDAALVTAHTDQGRRLFAVNLRDPGVDVSPVESWVARGLRAVPSGPVRFDHVPARPVGGPGWYLDRPGFAWGGIGVAACWFGGALGLYDTLLDTTSTRDRPMDAMHLGLVDRELFACAAAFDSAARSVDAGEVADPAVLALQVRAVVAESVERVMTQVGHALGPAPLSFDEQYAARMADLTLYVRQHHAERDLVALGDARLAAERSEPHSPRTHGRGSVPPSTRR